MFEVVLWILKDIQPGRLTESLIFLVVLLWRIRPHLRKVEDRLAGLEIAVREGFQSGERRFINVESRLSSLEKKIL